MSPKGLSGAVEEPLRTRKVRAFSGSQRTDAAASTGPDSIETHTNVHILTIQLRAISGKSQSHPSHCPAQHQQPPTKENLNWHMGPTPVLYIEHLLLGWTVPSIQKQQREQIVVLYIFPAGYIDQKRGDDMQVSKR